ncbi:DUF4374 domain-containing protein [Reichenbachiella versicolor]|uniref:DUF4374 domain-containing protein n=1 Tax=Reichenbachiella versicolor TaxID=1821036 RepID=UPI000D6E3982|nr:DUF4374 domain-containing protein [Reichenbachiella versicolor]
MKNTLYILVLSILASIVLPSCDEDDLNFDRGITFLIKTTGGDEPEYVVTEENIMSGTLSAEGVGFESFDWNFSYTVGKTLFVLGYENFEAKAYQVDAEGKVAEIAKFLLETPLEVFGNVNNETMLAIDAPRDGSHTARKLYFIDASTGFITGIKDISIYDVDTGTAGAGVSAWPTALQVVGDKLFIPFYLVDDAGGYTTPNPDKAYVAVYSYPNVESEPIKIIESDKTSNIGVNGTSTGLIQNDEGHLFSYSSGSYLGGFLPVTTKPSGILKINNGESEFDEDYFFDVENAENGGILFWMDYAGEGKALARLLVEDVDPATDPGYDFYWGAFGRGIFNQKLVVIDLDAKTITPVADVPLNAKRYTTPLLIQDGMTYVSIETEDEAYVYQVDINNATAIRGAKIEGKTIKGFCDLY